MRRLNIQRPLAAAALLSAGVMAAGLAPASAGVGGPAFYVDGSLYRTVGTPTDLSGTQAPAQSWDVIYEFFGAQANVADAAPGDVDYNGGRWQVHALAFPDGYDAALTAGDLDGDGVLDSAEEVAAAIDAGSATDQGVGLTMASLAAGAAPTALPVWGTVPTPNRGDLANALLGLTIISPDDIWAVGEYNSGVPPTVTGRRTLVEHWNGTDWRLVESPDPSWQGLDLATLEAVDGVSANDVWAVGHADDFATLRSTTLIERWNGNRWQIVRSPNPGGEDRPNHLLDVVSIAANNAWAVGGVGYPARALTLRWNGTRWRNQPNGCGVPLRGIAAVSPTELWAVGDNTTCRFDGVTWTVVPSPQPRPEFRERGYQLEAVSAAAPDDVWAVGSRVIDEVDYLARQSFAEHWDGTRWTAFYDLAGQTMFDLQATSRGDAWAAGTDGARHLILHWDGSAWSSVPTPSPARGGALNAVDSLGASPLWAAGAFYNKQYTQRTLVEQAPSATQGQVVGTTNVAFATVSWIGPASGSTQADGFGNYAAPGLPAGAYTFVVSSPGCDPASATVNVNAGTTTVQDFRLSC